jgi:hypothetical protein
MIVSFLFCGVTAMSQIYVPPNPTVYGSNNNRIKAIYSIGFPSKSDTTLNTTDDSPQIFYMTTDSTFWAYSKERGFFKLASGGGCDTCIAYSTVSADSLNLYLIRQNGDTAQIYSWQGEGSSGEGSGGIQSVQAGDNITVDNSDPSNPIVSAVLTSIPSLQEVTDIDTFTTRGITSARQITAFGSSNPQIDAINSLTLKGVGIGNFEDGDEAGLFFINVPSNIHGTLYFDNLTTSSKSLQLPNTNGNLAEGITNGTTTVHANTSGIVDISSILGSGTFEQSLQNQGSTPFSTDNTVAFNGHTLEFDSVSSFIINPIGRDANLLITPEMDLMRYGGEDDRFSSSIVVSGNQEVGASIALQASDTTSTNSITVNNDAISITSNLIRIGVRDSSTNDGSNVLFLKGDTLKRGSINPYTIKGKLTICGTGTDTLIFNGPQGGIWKSMDTSKVFVDPYIGVAHVKIVGSPTIITYSVLMNGSYYTASIPINGDISPNAGNITTSDSPIVGSQMTITIEDGMSGGKWVSNNTSRATVTPLNETQAIVNCISGGNVIIAYTVTTACGTSTANLPFFISTP